MLFCSVSGLPCQFPVVCTVCGAIYEDAIARQRIADKINCISGHELLPNTCISIKNGPVHTEESLEHVRISALSGVLDYFGTLVSSLANDNYALRKQLAQSCSTKNSDSIMAPPTAYNYQTNNNSNNTNNTNDTNAHAPSSIRVLQQIQHYTPQLVAIRTRLPLPPIIHSTPHSLAELCGRLKGYLTFSNNPVFNLFSTGQRVSVDIQLRYIWPIYKSPCGNSDRVSITFIAVSASLYVEAGETRLPINGTVLLFIQSSYIYNGQDKTITLQDICSFIDLDKQIRAMVTLHEVSYVHPYGLYVYIKHQNVLTVIPITLETLGYLTDISFSISTSTTCLSQTQVDSLALDVRYEGNFLSINPDGRLLLTYVASQSAILLFDICQLPYKLGPLLQFHIDDIYPIRADWDGTGKEITLVGRDGESVQMRLEKGTLLRSK